MIAVKKLLREPLVHFLFIGTTIFLLYGAFATRAPTENDKTLVVSASEIEWMQYSWQQSWGRPPTREELDRLIQQYIRETVLYREALEMGLDKDDEVIRRRLAQRMEFIAKNLAPTEPPTDEALRTYFEAHKDRYRKPAHYTFTQVFIDPDKHGDTALQDAQAIQAELIAKGDALDDAGALGDRSPVQHYYPKKNRAEIARKFGPGFAQSLTEMSPGQWHGPVVSDYGLHLVYVNDILEPPPPVFAEVRDRVEQDWTAVRSEDLDETFYTNLLKTYTVVIEEPTIDDPPAERPEPSQ